MFRKTASGLAYTLSIDFGTEGLNAESVQGDSEIRAFSGAGVKDNDRVRKFPEDARDCGFSGRMKPDRSTLRRGCQ